MLRQAHPRMAALLVLLAALSAGAAPATALQSRLSPEQEAAITRAVEDGQELVFAFKPGQPKARDLHRDLLTAVRSGR